MDGKWRNMWQRRQSKMFIILITSMLWIQGWNSFSFSACLKYFKTKCWGEVSCCICFTEEEVLFSYKIISEEKVTNSFAYMSSYQNAEEQRQHGNALLFPPKETTLNPVNYMNSTQCHIGSTCVLFIVEKLADRKCQYCF